MPRPKCCRTVGCMPDTDYFKPRGASHPGEVILTLDEYEAVRLADYAGLYQEQAAGIMNISRQTFGRIIDSAHAKIADMLVNGKALKIEGGEVEVGNAAHGRCARCLIKLRKQPGRTSAACPHCRKLTAVTM